MRLRVSAAALAACFASVLPARAGAQAPASPAPEQPCAVVPDTAVVPTPRQVAERRALRASIDSLARANGVASPEGLLLVDVDSTRRGKVIFMDTNLPDETVKTATRYVADYLYTLPPGKSYQALIRVNGDYVAPAHGRRNCRPVLANNGELSAMMQRVLARHPESRTRETPVARRAVVWLVVNREGAISHVDVAQPTGDENIDPYLEEISRRLRFLPARLEGEPYDVRMRFSMTFNVK